jgi:hypothetical protein
MGYSGAGGKLFHEKTRSKKSRDYVPVSGWDQAEWLERQTANARVADPDHSGSGQAGPGMKMKQNFSEQIHNISTSCTIKIKK